MGRIKSKLVRRVGTQILESTEDSFSKDFGQNKKSLGSTLPSKRMRNMVAGFITRKEKNKKNILEETNTETN